MAAEVDLIVRGGVLVSGDGSRPADIAIAEGRVASIEPRDRRRSMRAREVVDVEGLHVLPGVVDPHVHFREPGMIDAEDWASGSAAAVFGGVTTVLEMPNTLPPTDSRPRIEEKVALAEGRAWCDLGLYGLLGQSTVAAMAGMAEAGVIGFKAFLGPSTGDLEPVDDATLAVGLREAARLRRRVAVHAEDATVVAAATERVRATGRTDPLAHVDARPIEAEVAAIDRVGRLALETGCPVHVLHVSSSHGLAAVERWRRRGVDATCELTPHHAMLAAEDMERLGGRLRVNPPVRSRGHGGVLVEALADGRIDLVGSDHAPHRKEDKLDPDIWKTASGFPGVETALRLWLSLGVHGGRITLPRLVRASSEAPARAWGLWPRKGAVAVGSDADLVVVDVERSGVVRDGELHSRSAVTPWDGTHTRGAVVATVVRGQVVMRDGELRGAPAGRLVRPLSSVDQ